jgi:hypothetical protein
MRRSNRSPSKPTPACRKISTSTCLPHKLRHTALKDAANKYDVRFALELSGHTSPHYIWQYTAHTQ